MSVTSTRRVSGSYQSTVNSPYAATHGHSSFVENIDTTNNVLIGDDSDSRRYKQFEKNQESENKEEFSGEEKVSDNSLHSSSNLSPLLDNDEEIVSSVSNKNVDIYGTNQGMSVQREDKFDNPYIKHFYENNEVIEDIDELV